MSRETTERCFLCRSFMQEFDIECDPEHCWHEEQSKPHTYTLTRCVECDWRLQNALRARDLIEENKEIARELDELRRTEGASMDRESA